MIGGRSVLDKAVDDVILQGVHHDREKEHNEKNLHHLVPFRPSKGPIAHAYNPWAELKDDENTKFHAQQAKEIDKGLFKPPSRFGRLTVIPRLYGFRGVAKRR